MFYLYGRTLWWMNGDLAGFQGLLCGILVFDYHNSGVPFFFFKIFTVTCQDVIAMEACRSPEDRPIGV